MLKAGYKIRIKQTVAKSRAIKAWETRRKNGTTTPWNKGTRGLQIAWNKGLNKSSDSRVLAYSEAGARTIRKQFKEGRRQYQHTPEINAKMAVAKLGDKNPMRKHPELAEGSRRNILLFLQKQNKPPTDIERILYNTLDSLGIGYRTKNIVEWLSIPDAHIAEAGMVIYADRGYWHSMPKAVIRDKKQNSILSCRGYTVLRFSDKEIKADNFASVLAKQLAQVNVKKQIEAKS